MMRSIYMVMNIHIYGTFEKESQWRGASDRSGHIYIIYTYTYIHTYISKTYIDAEFDVESFRMVYLIIWPQKAVLVKLFAKNIPF